MARSRIRRPPLPPATVGLLVTLVAAALLGLWWLVTGGPGGGRRHLPTSAVSGLPGRSAERPLPTVLGPISRFDRTVAERLLRDRPSSAPLRGWLRLLMDDVAWNDPRGQPFLRAERLTGRLDASALVHGDVVVAGADAVRPRVSVYRLAGDTLWSWERVLAAFLASPAPGEPVRAPGQERLVEVRGLALHDAFVSIRQPEYETRFLGVNATLPRVTLSAPNLPAPIVLVAQGSATFERPDRGWRLPFTARGATVTFPGDSTRFAMSELAFGKSRFTDIRGYYDSALPGLGVRATGSAPAFELADLKPFVPPGNKLDLTGSGSFDWRIDPTSDAGVRVALTDLRFNSGGSHAAGAVSFTALRETAAPALESADVRLAPVQLALLERLTGRKLPYGGQVTGRVTGTGGAIRFDLDAHLAASGVQAFDVGLTGAAAFTPAGLALRNAVAELRSLPLAALRPVLPGLPLRGRASGRITISGPPGRTPLALDARLELPAGVALLNGTLDLTGPEPAYDVTGRLMAIRLREILAANVPPVSLTARFAMRGSGVRPATARSSFSLDGRFSGWRAGPNDAVTLRGSVAGGVLRLDTLAARLATATATAAGAWPFGASGAGAIRYDVALADLAPFGPYLPRPLASPAAGSARLAGTLGGTLENPRLSGGLAIANARAGGWSLAEASGTYALTLGGAVPGIGLQLRGRGLATPSSGRFSSFNASVRLASPLLDVSLRAERPEGGVVELAANGNVPPQGARNITVRQLVLDEGGRRWQLLRPAPVRWVPGGSLSVQGLVVQQSQGPGRLELDGTLLPADLSDYRLVLNAIPIAPFYQLVGRTPPLTGLVYADARVRGPASAPSVNATFHLDSGTVQGVKVVTLQGTLLYANSRLTADMSGVLAQGGAVTAHAALPVALSLGLPPHASVLRDGPVSGSLVADTVPLALLASMTTQVTRVAGVFSARMSLSGTAQQPVLGGAASLVGGDLTIPAAGQRYRDIRGTLVLRDRRIMVDSLSARSDGTALLSGLIDFPELRNPVAQLTLTLDRFRPLGNADNPQAAAWGVLTINGPLSAPVVRGAVRMDQGNLMVPMGSSGTADVLGEATALGIATPGPAAGKEALPAVPLSERIRLDGVRLTAGPALWFQTPDARVQLSGVLTLNKDPDAGLRVLGTLEGQRGTYTVVAGLIVRRLDISQARIRFFGTSELNPQLDIVATKTVLDPTSTPVGIQARITGTLDNPQLHLSTAQGVQIPESELLSFLVFGQPSFALGNGTLGQSLLQQTVYGGITELASMQLQQSLTASGLPLDVLEIQSSPRGVPSTLVVGRELAPDVFITVQTAIGELFGNAGQAAGSPLAVRVDWRLTPRLTAALGYEPTNQAQRLRGFLANIPQQLARQNQIMLELRRRWSY